MPTTMTTEEYAEWLLREHGDELEAEIPRIYAEYRRDMARVMERNRHIADIGDWVVPRNPTGLLTSYLCGRDGRLRFPPPAGTTVAPPSWYRPPTVHNPWSSKEADRQFSIALGAAQILIAALEPEDERREREAQERQARSPAGRRQVAALMRRIDRSLAKDRRRSV